MFLLVLFQRPTLRKRRSADLTTPIFSTSMSHHMRRQIPFNVKFKWTQFTTEVFSFRMTFYVLLEIGASIKGSSAFVATVGFFVLKITRISGPVVAKNNFDCVPCAC